jgi:4-aminobutyrate aminotransferase-like enzyme/Ser/Thr protein kinase RdoA (MazF antagonist)
VTSDRPDVLDEPAPDLDEAALRAGLAQHWSRPNAALRPLGSERDLNALVDGAFVIKICNPAEPPAVVDMETAALAHIARVAPDLPVPATVPTVTDGRPCATVTDGRGRRCVARLITALPGTPLEGVPVTTDLAGAVGEIAARIQVALQGFFHPAASRTIGWDIRRLPELVLADDRFASLAFRVRPALVATAGLQAWIQHADVSLTNVLADSSGVTGVIDLGDMHHTAAVCDLAVTLTSVLRNTADRRPASTWELAAAVLDGYQRHRPLQPDEAAILGELVLARLLVTAAVSARRAARHTDNTAYITRYDAANRRVLDELAALTPAELGRRIARLAGTSRAPRSAPSDPEGAGTAHSDDLFRRRRRVMAGPLSPLFYRRPLHIVRGQGPWLFTADGTRMLDAYNNVAVVGHAHPVVTQAVSRQLAAVNTHSRYLHDGVVELAERILATMPDELDTCLFTTSGTEANELAWRLATAYTGGTGALIAEHAYHGTTRWMADLSPNEWPAGYRPAHVETFRAPRDLDADNDEDVAVQRVTRAAARLRSAGDPPALVLADSMFTSEGILDAPPGFLRGLRSGANAVGALYLADEVQAGYGRPGPALWRFALAGVVPDIVSLGKPMGAGYPIGAVVTRREIADALAKDYEYFSTFAATPVAAAAGLAVLDLLADRDIPSRAAGVGDYLRATVRDLGGLHPVIGQVRGTGLVAGIDLRAPEGRSEPDFAREVLDGLVAHGVLAGLTGPTGTVLKVRPPLIWERAHADLFVTALDRVLSQVARPGR